MQTPYKDMPGLLSWKWFGRTGQNLHTFRLIRSRFSAGVCFHDLSTLTIRPKKKITTAIKANAMERSCIIFNVNLST